MSAENGEAPGSGLDWFAVWEVVGIWFGATGTAVTAGIALWLACRRLRPALHFHPSLVTKEAHLREITWKVDLSNRTPIAVRLVRGDLFWRAPTWSRLWARGSRPADLARVTAHDRDRKPADFRDNYPVELAGYEGAQLWVIFPRSHDFTTGPRWRQWLAYRSLRLVLQNATGEQFTVRAPKGWEREAPKDPAAG